MNIPKELIDQWLTEGIDSDMVAHEYIAYRAAAWALSQPVSMEPVLLEALKRARDTAMKYTLVARIPECGHFGGIAQDLDYVYAAIAEVKP